MGRLKLGALINVHLGLAKREGGQNMRRAVGVFANDLESMFLRRMEFDSDTQVAHPHFGAPEIPIEGYAVAQILPEVPGVPDLTAEARGVSEKPRTGKEVCYARKLGVRHANLNRSLRRGDAVNPKG
jgi:hypothetical protein